MVKCSAPVNTGGGGHDTLTVLSGWLPALGSPAIWMAIAGFWRQTRIADNHVDPLEAKSSALDIACWQHECAGGIELSGAMLGWIDTLSDDSPSIFSEHDPTRTHLERNSH